MVASAGISLLFSANLNAAILEVGPGKEFARPSDAAKAAREGDVIEISAGTYLQDVAVWHAHRLVIRGVGGRPHLKADGASAEGKAIWVIKGNGVVVENIEFSGARVPDLNGAGIRMEGTGLTIRQCFFHDNEMGLLTSNNPEGDVLIEHSEFANSGAAGEYSQHKRIGHNIYIGHGRSFTLRFSYVHHARIGHNVKSRARENYILYNRIVDEQTGASSYLVDLPNGGTSYLIGNVIQKGPHADNTTLVSYAAEGESNPSHGLYIVNNTLANYRRPGTYIKNWSKTTRASIINNIFASFDDKILDGPGDLASNLISMAPGFVSVRQFDYRLTAYSRAIDAGIDAGAANGFSLVPLWHYLHSAGKEDRVKKGPIDIGAYEFVGQ
ncbi:MAG: right-handed parallel beta-helix repeat-containing protein [Deltaproteobacteria bacterium]|nr:right-handed parallel beta-helix repeat-containing protein [Deltaproteobacteria bacterium]